MTLQRNSLVAIPADSYAQLTAETVIGDKFVDISSGRSPQTLRPNTELVYREPTDMRLEPQPGQIVLNRICTYPHLLISHLFQSVFFAFSSASFASLR